MNELYWGDRECDGPPAAKDTMYRGVVVIGCIITQAPGLAGVLSATHRWRVDMG